MPVHWGLNRTCFFKHNKNHRGLHLIALYSLNILLYKQNDIESIKMYAFAVIKS